VTAAIDRDKGDHQKLAQLLNRVQAAASKASAKEIV
jgi:hypothetical protein